jgi:hypothetical protein
MNTRDKSAVLTHVISNFLRIENNRHIEEAEEHNQRDVERLVEGASVGDRAQ